MIQSIEPKALSKAVKTLADEVPSFKITSETTIMSIFDRYIAHEEEKARNRCTSGMFISDEAQE